MQWRDEAVRVERAAMNSTGRHVALHAWFGVCAQAVDKLLPVAVLLYLARTLSPAAFGVYSFVLAYLAFFQTISDYGIDTVLVRAMSQDHERSAAILRSGLGLKLVMAVASAAIAVALVGPISGGRVPTVLMVVASLSLPSALGGAYRAYFRARLEISSVFFIAAGRAVLYGAGVVVAVATSAHLEAIFAAIAIANLLTFVGVAVILRRHVSPGLAFDRAVWSELWRGAIPLVANAFAMTLSLRVGQIMLMSMRGPVAVGMLGATSRVAEAFSLLPEALMITIYPLMAGLHGSDPARLRWTAERSARYLVVATGLPVVVSAVAGAEIMQVLFGPSFAQAGSLLAILAFTAVLSASGTVILNLLVAVHRETALFRNTLVFAVVNTALSFVLIDMYGAMGAAVAILATSAASQIALAVLPNTREHVLTPLRASIRPAIAICIGVALGRYSGANTLSAPLVGLGGYALALVVLGVANRQEYRFLCSIIGVKGASLGD